MTSPFKEEKNILNRFFFIFGSTDDCFCGTNFVVMDLKFSLNKHLKDCGYRRIIFYSKNERIHFYDDESCSLTTKTPAKTEAKQTEKKPMLLKGPLKSRMASQSEKPVATRKAGVLHLGGMKEIDAFNMIDFCMNDDKSKDDEGKNLKTAVVITDADNFIHHFGDDEINLRNKVLNSFNRYNELGYKNSNIMLLIFPSPITESEHNENRASVWYTFFKPRSEKGKVTKIQISPPLVGEIRNAIHYSRLMHGLKVEFSQIDNICRNIAKNFYAEDRALDSLKLLMSKLDNLADGNSILNEKIIVNMLEEKEKKDIRDNQELPLTLAFRGMLTNLSEDEIKQAEDITFGRDEAVSIDDILKDLDKKMFGITEAKKKVRELAEGLKIQKERIELEKAEAAAKGEKYKPRTQEAECNNIVITGNPGTGKTVIARYLAKLFRSIGLSSRDKLVECLGVDLKGSYRGQSKDKVNDYYERAKGGVLFVDEAYSLVNEQGPVDDFADEAIVTLMAHLLNDGDKFITIAAGYKNQMDLFLDKSNPGMRRRFSHFIHLPDYSAEDLFTILEDFNVRKAGFSLSDDAREEAKKRIRNIFASRGPNFGNAGDMLELFKSIKLRQASRLNKLSPEERREKLYLIEATDIRDSEDKVLSMDEVLFELEAMTGMTEVKKRVRSMAQKIRTQKEREEKTRAEALARGETWEPKADQKQGNHIVLTGNPGTGKNTVVRMLAKLFKAIGALPTDKLVEINGNDLSSGYQGQTKEKVNEYCRQAMGGVLFIDEAYVLANEHGAVDSYAKQAAETLMTHLENEKDKFICVVAGYEHLMGLFLDKLNPGMRSRFNHFINISDYSAEELFEIFEKKFVKDADLSLTDGAKDAARKEIDAMLRKKLPNFGNARAIRTLFEEITSRQSDRVSVLPDAQRTLAVLNTIEAEDIGEAVKSISIDEVLADLDAMVGMKEVKETVRGIANKLAHQKKIMEQTGKAPDKEGNNICITGNPGTGKTTIARTMAKLFKVIGFLSNDKLLEIQGANLKGSFLGQSKDKVDEYCRQAMGGVLFIDETYSLVNERGPADEYSQEAITMLLAHLENDREKFVCIVAGYPKEMDTFIMKSNPGMERRFKHYIHLPDYSTDELIEIFERFNVKKSGFTLTDAAQEKAREAIRMMVANKKPNFGNAGDIRTFFEKVTGNTANRVSKLPDDQQIAALQLIEAEDIP
jgi:SpoVK/Ycf46/Vps4 family AAA+-type ATPase